MNLHRFWCSCIEDYKVWAWRCSYSFLNFWQNLSLNVLINLVLIQKTCNSDFLKHLCLVWIRFNPVSHGSFSQISPERLIQYWHQLFRLLAFIDLKCSLKIWCRKTNFLIFYSSFVTSHLKLSICMQNLENVFRITSNMFDKNRNSLPKNLCMVSVNIDTNFLTSFWRHVVKNDVKPDFYWFPKFLNTKFAKSMRSLHVKSLQKSFLWQKLVLP